MTNRDDNGLRTAECNTCRVRRQGQLDNQPKWVKWRILLGVNASAARWTLLTDSSGAVFEVVLNGINE
jgi:hypothetical protein